MTVRIAIVDDEPLVRAGLHMVLRPAPDIEVVAEAGEGREALTVVAEAHPDVVLVDIRMPGMDGLALLRELKRRNRSTAVIMLTTFDLDDYVHTALTLGADGFLLKDAPPRSIAEAVRTVASGHAMLSPSVTRRLIDSYAKRSPAAARAANDRLSALTPRERAVVAEVAQGRSNAQAARVLGMTETTVKAHVSRILAKLGLENRVQIALLARDAEP